MSARVVDATHETEGMEPEPAVDEPSRVVQTASARHAGWWRFGLAIGWLGLRPSASGIDGTVELWEAVMARRDDARRAALDGRAQAE